MQLETSCVGPQAGDKSVNVSIEPSDLLQTVKHRQYIQSIRWIPPTLGWMLGDRRQEGMRQTVSEEDSVRIDGGGD